MGSAAQSYFNDRARPDLWAEHGETVALTDPTADASASPQDITVIWRRVRASGDTTVGVGAIAFSGEAMAVVKLTDLPAPPGARSRIARDGQNWEIRYCERQDAETWVLHLAKADLRQRMPQEIRR